MKKIYCCIIILCIILFTSGLKGQIFTGYQLSAGNYPTFNLLVESFNDCNMNILSKPLENFKVLHGTYLAVNIYGFELGYHKSYSSSMAAYLNGDKRHFKMTFSYVDFLIDASYGDNFIRFGPLFGGCRGRINIDSYYEYADGRLDFSQSKVLNGSFRTNYEGYVGLIAGLKLRFNFSERFSLFLRAERIFPIVAGELLVKNKANSFIPYLEPYLPTDYTHYESIINNQLRLPVPYRVKSDLNPYNFSFGLQIPINFD